MRNVPARAALILFRFFPGRLAQLGERRLDKAEVTGSSPVSPISIMDLRQDDLDLYGPVRSSAIDIDWLKTGSAPGLLTGQFGA